MEVSAGKYATGELRRATRGVMRRTLAAHLSALGKASRSALREGSGLIVGAASSTRTHASSDGQEEVGGGESMKAVDEEDVEEVEDEDLREDTTVTDLESRPYLDVGVDTLQRQLEVLEECFETGLSAEAVVALETVLHDEFARRTLLPCAGEHYPVERIETILDAVKRAVEPDYVPTEADLLAHTWPTVGRGHVDVDWEGTGVRLVDCGGQRPEKRKWREAARQYPSAAIVFVFSTCPPLNAQVGDENPFVQSIALLQEICAGPKPLTAGHDVLVVFTKEEQLESNMHLALPVFRAAFPELHEADDDVTPAFIIEHLRAECVALAPKAKVLDVKLRDAQPRKHPLVEALIGKPDASRHLQE